MVAMDLLYYATDVSRDCLYEHLPIQTWRAIARFKCIALFPEATQFINV